MSPQHYYHSGAAITNSVLPHLLPLHTTPKTPTPTQNQLRMKKNKLNNEQPQSHTLLLKQPLPKPPHSPILPPNHRLPLPLNPLIPLRQTPMRHTRKMNPLNRYPIFAFPTQDLKQSLSESPGAILRLTSFWNAWNLRSSEN